MSRFRLFKASYRDRDGKARKSAKWYVEFRDHLQTVRRFAGFTSKPATDELGRNLVKLVEYHKGTGGQLDPSLSRWLAGLSESIRSKLVEIGLLDRERFAASKLLADHLADFAAALTAKANTSDHVAMVTGRARRVFDGCEFRYYSDITATRVQSFLNDLRAGTEKKPGISAQTFNFHLGAVKQFCRWMVKNRRATTNPVDYLEPLNVKVDRRRDRRALTVEELRNLLTITTASLERDGMTGPERALLYRLAVETGLRSNELRTLTRGSFDLNAQAPTVTVAAGNSKRRREDILPLRPELAAALRDHLSNKTADAPAFHLHRNRKIAARMFRADTDAAGIVFRDDAGRVVDFHALRHTFITNLARGRVHPKVAQSLARHSTITLTMDRYSHTVIEEQADALKVLPDLSGVNANMARKTGTDGRVDGGAKPVVLASCLASFHAKQRTPSDSGGRSDKTECEEDEPVESLRNQGVQHKSQANGSVSESNRQRALFTPATGFEDLGQHQLCKHSQGCNYGLVFTPSPSRLPRHTTGAFGKFELPWR